MDIGLDYQVGLKHGHCSKPFFHTSEYRDDDLTLESALETLEQAPASTLEVWAYDQWIILFDGQDEFAGVKPENWI